MKTSILVLSAALALPLLARAADPSDPNASAGARQVFNQVQALNAAGFVLAGQQVGYTPWLVNDLSPQPAPNESEIAHVFRLTGKYPALVGMDWDQSDGHADRRDSLIALAQLQAGAGGLVTFSWHEANPNQFSPDAVNGGAYNPNSTISTADWNNLLNVPGSAIHQNWLHHMNLVAGWLGQLQNAGVTVLWRPYHEADGAWFWWGNTAAANFKALWRMQHDYLTNTKGLHNLLWVYATAFADSTYYPGDAYVDFGGSDIYPNPPNPFDPSYTSRYQALKSMSGGKTVALTETGLLPDASLLFGRYAWAMIWYGGDLDTDYYGAPPSEPGTAGNTAALVQAFYADSRTVDRASIWTALAPAVKAAKKRYSTSASKIVIKGTATGGQLVSVKAKLPGKKKLVKAKGLAKWKLTVPLKSATTRVVLRAYTADGQVSKKVVVVITRKFAK